MPSTSSLKAKNLPAQPDPFLWLFELTGPRGEALIDPDGGFMVLRWTPNPEPVTWRTWSWGAYDAEFGEITISSNGDLNPITLSVSNAWATWFRLVEANDMLRDHILTMNLVHSLELASDEPALSLRTKVVDIEANTQTVTLALGAGAFHDFDVPKTLMGPLCRHGYRGPGCFFVGDPNNATLGLCAHTRAACNLRGDYEVANGLQKRHPKAFGGIVGLPKGPVRLG